MTYEICQPPKKKNPQNNNKKTISLASAVAAYYSLLVRLRTYEQLIIGRFMINISE